MTKAEVIAQIKVYYDPEDLRADRAQMGKDLVLDVCNRLGEVIDVDKWRSLLKETLEQIMALCAAMDSSDKSNIVRIAHGETSK